MKDRRVRLLFAGDYQAGTPSVVLLSGVLPNGKPQSDVYLLAEMACDTPGGRLFEVVGYRRRDAGLDTAVRRYSTLVLSADGSVDGSCDCRDGESRGHRRPCKHVLAIAALLRRGDL